MKTKIIGHRGAAGLELENTLASLRKALDIGVPTIEFDVRITKDSHAVLSHDADLARVSSDTRTIADLRYDELKKIHLLNGESVPLLSEAMKVFGDTPVIIETKDEGAARKVLRIIEKTPDKQVTITSIKPSEVVTVKRLRPGMKAYLKAVVNPFEVVYIAKAIGADGLNLNFWILNPLTYWMARHAGLDIMVFTVNSRFIAWFILSLYPKVRICTNNPHYFIRKKRGAKEK